MGITPREGPAVPGQYAQVATQPMDLQDRAADLTAVFGSAGEAGAGEENDIYGVGPRQAETAAVMKSPAGAGNFDILDGFSGQGSTTHGWPNDVRPASEPDNGGYGGA